MPMSCGRDAVSGPQALLSSAARSSATFGTGMMLSAGTAAPPPPEVVAKVGFEIGDHGGQMKVSMVDGNTAASVVAYCCAALGDRLGVELIPADYMLAVIAPGAAPKKPSEGGGYLFGLCEVLGHPDVRSALDEGRPITLDLRPLPDDHPNGMYVEERLPPPPVPPAHLDVGGAGGAFPSSDSMFAPPGTNGGPGGLKPPSTHAYPSSAFAQRAALDQAMTEEVERELSMMDWYRPGGGPPGTIGPSSTAARSAAAGGSGSAFAPPGSAAHYAKLRLNRVRDGFARGDAGLAAPRNASTGDLDASGLGGGLQSVASGTHAASPPNTRLPADGPGGGAVDDGAGRGAKVVSPQLRAAEGPRGPDDTLSPRAGKLPAPSADISRLASPKAPSFSVQSRAAEMLKAECEELKGALKAAQGEMGGLAETVRALKAVVASKEEENKRLVAEAAEKTAVARAYQVDKAELEELREKVVALRRDKERLADDLRRSEDRERDLQQEVLDLQKELTKEAADESAALDKILPNLVAAAPPVIPPPPPAAAPPRTPVNVNRFARHTQIGEEIVLSAKKLVGSPASPEVHIDPEDSLGTIVAKLTGKAALGAEVDKSLRTPVLMEEQDATPSAVPPPPPGPPPADALARGAPGPPSPRRGAAPPFEAMGSTANGAAVVHASPADDASPSLSPRTITAGDDAGPAAAPDALHARLAALARSVETLSDPSGALAGDADAKRAMLRQVTEIRGMIAPPTQPPTAHGAGGPAGVGGGPGSPGGPMRSASTYSYASASAVGPGGGGGYGHTAYAYHAGAMHQLPPAPPGPPSSAGGESVYSLPTRPPGI